MTWNEVISDPSLSDLPYKIELNRRGQIVMSPASNRHGDFQIRIGATLMRMTSSGKTISESSIDTDDGTKVADIVWMSDEFFKAYEFTTPYPVCPELCVEILSPSNTTEEMEEKCALYFSQGAKEVWLCDKNGQMSFYQTQGEIAQSQLFPDFPKSV